MSIRIAKRIFKRKRLGTIIKYDVYEYVRGERKQNHLARFNTKAEAEAFRAEKLKVSANTYRQTGIVQQDTIDRQKEILQMQWR